MTRYAMTWGNLQAIEPTRAEVAAHAAALARAYNEPRNAAQLGHTDELAARDVIDHYANVPHGFLLFADGALAGDGDLRGLAEGAAEFAFLITDPAAQGKGLGTRFAQLVHALAFGPLGLERVYASVIPANVASRRVFEKLGYTVDASAAGRRYADEPDDLVLAIDRATFARHNAAALAAIQITPR